MRTFFPGVLIEALTNSNPGGDRAQQLRSYKDGIWRNLKAEEFTIPVGSRLISELAKYPRAARSAERS